MKQPQPIVKKSCLLIIAILCFGNLIAQHYSPIDNGSSLKFAIKNFGINASGTFKGLKGNIDFQPNNLSVSNFTVTLDATTIDTHIGARDKHLKKEEYFDVAKYPTLNFTSTKIINSGTTEMFIMVGNLVIKGVTKQITFPFSAHAQDNGYLFSGNFNINRRDFNVGGKSMVLSDDVIVSLVVFAEKINN